MPRTRKLPLYCYREKNRHGKFAFYVRRDRHGTRIRLPDDYGSDAWWKAYHAALGGEAIPVQKPRGTSLEAMLTLYQQSQEFTTLAMQTRKYRSAQFRTMIVANPDVDAAKIKPTDIHRAMSRRTPDAANNFLKAMRGFFSWAVKLGYLPSDPSAGIAKAASKSEGFHSITEQEVATYRAFHRPGTVARRAFEVFVLTGARRADAAILGPLHVIDGMIEFQAQKTKEWCYVPVLPDMQPIIDEAMADGRETFIAGESGKPYAAESLGNMMQRWFAECGLPHCSAHGIRKYAATNFANHGVSAHQLMAIFGWKKISQAEVYTKKVDRRKLAREAGGMVSPRTAP